MTTFIPVVRDYMLTMQEADPVSRMVMFMLAATVALAIGILAVVSIRAINHLIKRHR